MAEALVVMDARAPDRPRTHAARRSGATRDDDRGEQRPRLSNGRLFAKCVHASIQLTGSVRTDVSPASDRMSMTSLT